MTKDLTDPSHPNYEASWRSSLAFFADAVVAAPHRAEELLTVYTKDSAFPDAERAARCLVRKVVAMMEGIPTEYLFGAMWDAAYALYESDSDDEGDAGAALRWSLGHLGKAHQHRLIKSWKERKG